MAQPEPTFSFKWLAVKLAIAAVLIAALVALTVYFSAHRPTLPRRAASTGASAASPAGGGPSSLHQADTSGRLATPSNLTGQGGAQGGASMAGQAMQPQPTTPAWRDFNVLAGVRFTDRPDDARKLSPRVKVIELRLRPANYAVWGATGQDHRGSVWVGVSADERTGASAQLVQYDALTDRVIDRGIVTQRLRQAGQIRMGAGQSKLHSRIVPGADGYLYFSSMDDDGSEVDEAVAAYLWRTRPPEYVWEPLFSTPQALIAVAGFGTDIYALGDPGHVLYHFDTLTGKHHHVTVGTLPGHISRNFVVDVRGHAYVPRVQTGLLPGDPPRVELVQYNRALQQIAVTPLAHYMEGRPADSHGLIASTMLADRSIVIATHMGRLYRIEPAGGRDQPAKVTDLGWFHPDGSRYTPTMHTIDGSRYLVGVVKVDRPAQGQTPFEWVTHDLWFKESHAEPLMIPAPAGHGQRNLLLYGSMTRDAAGRFYIAGTHLNAGLALLVQLTLPSSPSSP